MARRESRDERVRIKADGDTWRGRLGERPTTPGTRVVLFFCETTNQRPYRVVEVAEERVPDASGLADLPEEELRELWEAAVSMDYPRTFHRSTPSPE